MSNRASHDNYKADHETMCDGPARVRIPAHQSPKKKKKRKTEEKNSRRESSSSSRRLPIGVGKELPPALFKEEIPPLSLPPKIEIQSAAITGKPSRRPVPVPIQLLTGKASPASEVSLLPFLSSPLSFPCLCARSPATRVAGFCCGRNLYFCRFSLIFDAGGHHRPSVWPSSCRRVAPLLPKAAPRRLRHRSELQ